jgi:hypothetical protein
MKPKISSGREAMSSDRGLVADLMPGGLISFAVSLFGTPRAKIAAQVLTAIAAGFILSTVLEPKLFPPAGSWPVFGVLCYALMGCTKWFHRVSDAPLFAAGALLGLVLQGMTRAPEPPDFVTAPLLLLAVACICSALLAYFAKRWILLAGVVALPQWLEILFWMERIPLFGWDGLEMLVSVLDQSLPLPIAAFAGAALAKLAGRIRRG